METNITARDLAPDGVQGRATRGDAVLLRFVTVTEAEGRTGMDFPALVASGALID